MSISILFLRNRRSENILSRDILIEEGLLTVGIPHSSATAIECNELLESTLTAYRS